MRVFCYYYSASYGVSLPEVVHSNIYNIDFELFSHSMFSNVCFSIIKMCCFSIGIHNFHMTTWKDKTVENQMITIEFLFQFYASRGWILLLNYFRYLKNDNKNARFLGPLATTWRILKLISLVNGNILVYDTLNANKTERISTYV